MAEWPEQAYQKVAAHWANCPTCKSAGGEEAGLKDLCPTGAVLTEQWWNAERTWAEAEREKR